MRLKWPLVFLVFLTGCDNGEPNMIHVVPTIKLALNVPIDRITENSLIGFSQECMKNLGLCWYKLEVIKNKGVLPRVSIAGVASALDLEQVLGVIIVIDESVGRDVENIDITLRGLPDNSTHEQNRAFILALIDSIKNAGWAHFFMPEDPRISGSQAEKINTPGAIFGQRVSSHPWLDPDYQVDLVRWLQNEEFYNWYFYSDSTYLHLKAWRLNSDEEPEERGTYLITLEFQSEREFWLSGVSNDNERTHWKEFLPKRLESARMARLILEDKARAAGIEIDETYQDPPIKALSR